MKFDVGIPTLIAITEIYSISIGDYIKIVLKIVRRVPGLRDNYKFVLRGLVLPRGSFGFALTHYTELRRVLRVELELRDVFKPARGGNR